MLPCLMSLILTVPKRMSLPKRKSKRLKRPSSLSSLGPDGNEESRTGGEAGVPLIDSAILMRFKPLQSRIFVNLRFDGRCPFAQLIRPSSTTVCYVEFESLGQLEVGKGLTNPESATELCLFLIGRWGVVDDLMDAVSYELTLGSSIGLGIWSPGKKDSTRPLFSLASPFTFSAPSNNT